MTKDSFFNQYESLEKSEKKKFRKRVIKACFIEPPTFYSWLQRRRVSSQSQQLIALELNQSVETLFPNH